MENDRIINKYSLRILDKIYEIDRILSNIQRKDANFSHIRLLIMEIRNDISFMNDVMIDGPHSTVFPFIEFPFIFGKIDCTRLIINNLIEKDDRQIFRSSLVSIRRSICAINSAAKK